MEIQKYKAKIKGTDTEVIGYITETREQLGSGAYGNGVDYLISVTEKSMPNGKYGTFKVDEESIKPVQKSKQLIDFIKWLENKIEVCLEDKDLQREHWAFCQALKKYRELALTIPAVGNSASLTESQIEHQIKRK